MNNERKERPLSTTVAAVVLAALSAAGLAAPLLLGGGVPASAAYVSVASGAAGLAAVYGLWTLERWGTVLSVVVTGVDILSAAPGLAFAPTPGLLVQAVGGGRGQRPGPGPRAAAGVAEGVRVTGHAAHTGDGRAAVPRPDPRATAGTLS